MHIIRFAPDTIEFTASRDVNGKESGRLWLVSRSFETSIPIVRGSLPREQLSLTAQAIRPHDEDSSAEVKAKYGCGYVDYVHGKATFAEERESYLSAVFTMSNEMMDRVQHGAKDIRNSKLKLGLSFDLKDEAGVDVEVWDVFKSKRIMLTAVSLVLSAEPASDA